VPEFNWTSLVLKDLVGETVYPMPLK